jgi:NADH-quinone oxidoreductase subunit L
LVALTGIFLAKVYYKNKNNKPDKAAAVAAGFYKAAVKKFYIDELYLFITRKIIFNLIGRPAAWFDKYVVDGLMNGIAATTGKTSSLIKGLQSGKVQQYALYFFGGIVTLTVIFLYLWK